MPCAPMEDVIHAKPGLFAAKFRNKEARMTAPTFSLPVCCCPNVYRDHRVCLGGGRQAGLGSQGSDVAPLLVVTEV